MTETDAFILQQSPSRKAQQHHFGARSVDDYEEWNNREMMMKKK